MPTCTATARSRHYDRAQPFTGEFYRETLHVSRYTREMICLMEENGPDKFKGIDIMRAVCSFDPCLPCGDHLYLGNGKVIEALIR
jgi:hypothetical protein